MSLTLYCNSFAEKFHYITNRNKWMGGEFFDREKFAEMIMQDYAKKTIQGLMRDPAFVQAMDEYYEKKWSHRFD